MSWWIHAALGRHAAYGSGVAVGDVKESVVKVDKQIPFYYYYCTLQILNHVLNPHLIHYNESCLLSVYMERFFLGFLPFCTLRAPTDNSSELLTFCQPSAHWSSTLGLFKFNWTEWIKFWWDVACQPNTVPGDLLKAHTILVKGTNPPNEAVYIVPCPIDFCSDTALGRTTICLFHDVTAGTLVLQYKSPAQPSQ